MNKEKTEYAVQAVNNFINIAELLVNHENELSTSEIALNLNLTKTNTVKILSTLELFNYVELNKNTGNYRLGIKTFQIAQAYLRKIDIMDISTRVMQEIKDKINETVYIGVLREGNAVFLKTIETDHVVRVNPRVNYVIPAYATAAGKALLPHLDFDDVKKYYTQKDFIKFTDNTITTFDQLEEECKRIKELGYAVDNEEYEKDVIGVGVTIYNFLNRGIASLVVGGPKTRMSKKMIEEEVVPVLKEGASSLSKKFGYKHQLYNQNRLAF